MGWFGGNDPEPEPMDSYIETKITPNPDGEGVKIEQTIVIDGVDVTPDK